MLNVAADGLAAAIAAVRESRKAERVQAYAAASGATGTGEVAVVIQAMVPAELAGVLFTVHPITRDLTTMLGNVVTGLGEALVSGEDTGAEFTLSRPDAVFTGPESLRPMAKRLHDARTWWRAPSTASRRTSSGLSSRASCGSCSRGRSPR